MKSTKEEALLILQAWQEKETPVSMNILGPGITLDGFCGSVALVQPDRVGISGADLVIAIGLPDTANFSWSEETGEDAEFDPEFFESVLRFETETMEVALAVVR